MTRFSRRFGYDPNLPKQPILEAAPESLRTAYLNTILDGITYKNYPTEAPIGADDIGKRFYDILRQDASDSLYVSPWSHLKWLVRDVGWFNFYDFVELVGETVKEVESRGHTEFWLTTYGFDSYKTKVNRLFSEDRIGWRLNEESQLVRDIPKPLSSRMSEISAALADDNQAARAHYGKAILYATGIHADPENAIKEITSAVESVGRRYYPNAGTLGDVVKEMRKERELPPHLVSLIEKFYAYASSEPAVRHGGAVPSRVVLADAEFCLHVGGALIRYLLEKHAAPF
jgi:AbiJ N-terminal domain 4